MGAVDVSAIKQTPDVMLREAASLLYLLGGIGSKHLTVVGGLVPPLLVPAAASSHIGSADIDLCLSVAITRGDTQEYYKSIQKLIEPYFEEVPSSSFRWRKKDGAPGLPLIVDFLGPESDSDTTTVDGTRLLEDEVAAENAGSDLRPFALRAGVVIDLDAETTTLDGVELLYHEVTRADVDVRHSGPVGFLAAKAFAFAGRSDTKDGYDVSWWCLNAAATPDEVAELVIARPAYKHDDFQEAVYLLKRTYKAPDYPGPMGYAAELFPELASGDDDFDQAANAAFAATSHVIELLHESLFK